MYNHGIDSFKQIQQPMQFEKRPGMNQPENSKKKEVKYSHINQFMHTAQSYDKNIFEQSNKNSARDLGNNDYGDVRGQIDFETMGVNNIQQQTPSKSSGYWGENNKESDGFTDEDYKRLEKKALPENYMGANDNDLKFY